MDVINYPYRRTARDVFLIVVGASLVFISLSSICTASLFVIGVVFGLIPGSAPIPIDHQGIPIGLAFCGFGIFGLFLGLLGGICIYGYLTPYEAILTRDSFSYGRHKRTRVMRLSEIINISGKTEYRADERLSWVVTIKDVRNQQIQFPVGNSLYRTIYGNFDYRAILRDLLSRLPVTAQVDQGVRSFTETGKIP